MAKWQKLLPVVGLCTVLLSSCSRTPAEDEELKALYSLEARLHEVEEELQEKEDRLTLLEEKAQQTQPVSAQVEVTQEEPAAQTPALKVGSVGLGYSRDLVQTLLGTPKTVTNWEWLDGSEHQIWNYEGGLSIKFFDRYVRSIRVEASGTAMDMGLSVGLLGKEAEESLVDRGLYPFTFQDGTTNTGWYESDRGELVILEYNPKGDLFNYGLSDSSNSRVYAYTLDQVASYR